MNGTANAMAIQGGATMLPVIPGNLSLLEDPQGT